MDMVLTKMAPARLKQKIGTSATWIRASRIGVRRAHGEEKEIVCANDSIAPDALSRVANASYVMFSRDPKLFVLQGALARTCVLDPVLYSALPA